MKVRTRLYKRSEDDSSFWTSFTDIMTTVCLVFFFIMIIVFISINKLTDDIAKERDTLYSVIENKLTETGMNDDVIYNKEEGKIEIKTELLFEFGSDKLTVGGENLAIKVSEAFCELLEQEKIRNKINYIEVVGHTDFIGSGTSNRRLSTNRAVSFIDQMMPPGSGKEFNYAKYFKATGMSEFEPKEHEIISVNKEKEAKQIISAVKDADKKLKAKKLPTDEMRKMDRRIEIRIDFNEEDINNAVKKINKAN